MPGRIGARIEISRNLLPGLSEELKERANEIIRESAIRIEQAVKNPTSPYAAPYRTGNLRRSYHHQRTGDLAYVVQNDAGLAPYAIFVEMGTRKMSARPHLTPAAEAERSRFYEAMGCILK